MDEEKDTSSTQDDRISRIERQKKREDVVSRQKKIIMIGIPVLIIIVIIIIIAMNAGGYMSDDNTDNTNDESISRSEDTSDEDVSEDSTEDNLSLKKNEDEDIKELVENYFAAISACDVDTLSKYVDDIGDITKDSLEANAQYIETYENIECYIKPGLYDNTYIVYVYYENKILNIETLAPGATTLYVIRDTDTDTVCIHNGVTDGEIASYMQTVSAEDDVVEFFENVNTKLAEACESDEDLKAFYDALVNATEELSSKAEETSETEESTSDKESDTDGESSESGDE